MSFEQGFTVIADCCSASECDGVRTHIDQIVGGGSRALLARTWCQTLANTLREFAARSVPELRSLIAVQCTYFNKSPTSNWFVAFHQDRSIPVESNVTSEQWPGWSRKEGMTFIHGPDELLADMIAIRLHIDPSGQDNGPLRVIPNSHRDGTLSPGDIEKVCSTATARTLTANQGDLILMRPLLLHASSKSRAITSRRVLHFLFGPRTLPDGLEWERGV